MQAHELCLVGFEAIQKSGDLLAVVCRRSSRPRGGTWPVMRDRHPKGLELADEVPHGDSPRDDGQIARKAGSAGKRTEGGGVISQAFENDIRDDVFSLGIRQCGAAFLCGSCRDVGEEATEPSEKLAPRFGVARDAAIQKSLIRGCDEGRNRLGSHGIESGEIEKRSPISPIIRSCGKAHHAETEQAHETNRSCRFQNR